VYKSINHTSAAFASLGHRQRVVLVQLIDSTCCIELARGGLHDNIVQKGEAELDRRSEGIESKKDYKCCTEVVRRGLHDHCGK
jgi:hypothetical protein